MTKAEVLNYLKFHEEQFFIEDLLFFSVNEWNDHKEKILTNIEQKITGKNIIVRSSAVVEDGEFDSHAGKFKSILNVPANSQSLEDAIEEVINSYSVLTIEEKLNSQVIVQPMTDAVELSGVIFSRENINGLPYYLINYEKTSTTNGITSGEINGVKEYVYHGNKENTKWSVLISVTEKIKQLLSFEEVDVEFAITCDGRLVIFQARPLFVSSQKYSDGIATVLKKCRQLSRHFLSDMAFWNPSEMIGARPRTLARTLYEYLITDRTWNEGIAILGYKRMRDKLMVSILGKPYILMDIAFDALLPSGIRGGLRKKLLSIYRSKIERHRHLHDKIEFEIVDSCFSFDLDKRNDEYANGYGLTPKETQEMIQVLKRHLVENINKADLSFRETLSDVRSLENRRSTTIDEYRDDKKSVEFSDIIALLEEARVFGVHPFAQIARMAFITEHVLRSACMEEPYLRKKFEAEKSNIITVTTVCNKTQSSDQNLFRKLFAHLRPGTYDIQQSTYYNVFDIASLDSESEESIFLQPSEFDSKFISDLQDKFDQASVEIDAEKFLEIYSASLQRREYYKYCFTKNISLSLELLKRYADSLGISRQILSDLDIKKCIDAGKLSINYYDPLSDELAILPEVIFEEKDILRVIFRCATPNFVTEKVAEGKIFILGNERTEIPEGSIVVLEKADPGFDWIFAYQIKALITKYGGSASHMTIRCNEMNIPAAIGCGELLYEKVIGNQYVTIDCRNKTIL